MSDKIPDCSNFYPNHICKKCVGCIASKKLKPKNRKSQIEFYIAKFTRIVNELTIIKNKFSENIFHSVNINNTLTISCENDIAIFKYVLAYFASKNGNYSPCDHRLITIISNMYTLSHGHARNFENVHSPFYNSAHAIITKYCIPVINDKIIDDNLTTNLIQNVSIDNEHYDNTDNENHNDNPNINININDICNEKHNTDTKT